MPDTPIRLSVVDVDDSTVALEGEIDAHTAPDLVQRFESLPPGDGEFSLDLSRVEFMDSSGLRVIIELHQRAEAESRRLVLRSPSSAVTRLIEISGLSDHLNVD
jgi:anti-sigma B factor antagonist